MKYFFKVETKVDEKFWNEHLLQTPSATSYQTAENLTSTSDHYFPVFISIMNENDDVVGQLAMTIVKTTMLYSSKILQSVLQIIKKISMRGSWSYGPIVHTNCHYERIEILRTLIQAIDFVCKKYDLVFVEGDTSPFDDFDNESKSLFIKNGYAIQERVTFVADMHKNIDDLWGAIHENARRDVKRAQKRQISVKELHDNNEIKDYLLLFTKWARTKGLQLNNSPQEQEKLWNNYQHGIETFLLAYENTTLISALRISHFNKIAIANFILSSYSESTSLGGPLLSWHALEWAKKNGMNFYDFTGGPRMALEESERNTQEAKLLFYKKKWGGNMLTHFSFRKPNKKLNYILFQILFSLIRTYHYYRMMLYKKS